MYQFKSYSYIILTASILVVFSGLLSCVRTETRVLSRHKVEIAKVKPPEGEYSFLVIKKVTFTDPKWEYLSDYFHVALIDKLF